MAVWELRYVPSQELRLGAAPAPSNFWELRASRCQAAANVWKLHQTLLNAAAAAKFDLKSQISYLLP